MIINRTHHYWYTFNLILDAGKSCIVIDGGNFEINTGEFLLLIPKFPRREGKSQIKTEFKEYWAKRVVEKEQFEKRRENNRVQLNTVLKVVQSYNFTIPGEEILVEMLKQFLLRYSSFSQKNLENYFKGKGGKEFHIIIGQPYKIKNGLEIDWNLHPSATSNVKSTPKDFNGIEIDHDLLEIVNLDKNNKIENVKIELEKILSNIRTGKPDISASLSIDRNSTEASDLMRLLLKRRQVIIYGPPGTGKTRLAKILASEITGKDSNIHFIQLHPNYDYANFIEGLFPQLNEEKKLITYEYKPGALQKIENKAKHASDNFCLIIDEINRGNLQKLLGEAFYCIEYRGSSNFITLASGNNFYLSRNVYIIGTMNTADRSIADIDFALRRRFGFFEVKTDSEVILNHFENKGLQDDPRVNLLIGLFDRINDKINDFLVGEDKAIGHSYFLLDDLSDDSILDMLFYAILPLLEDYFYHNKREINSVLNYEFITGELKLRKIERDELNLSSFLAGYEGE